MKREYRKILIIRTGAIGDVVHTTNLYRSIKRLNPDVEIHYLTSELIKPLLINDKDIKKVHTIDPKFKMFSDSTKNMAKTLRTENFDCVLNLQPSWKIRYLIFLSGIKYCFEYKKKFKMHAVDNFWATGVNAFSELKKVNELHLFLPEESIKFAQNEVENLKRPLIIINAGGVFSKRQGRTYPVEKWVEAGNKIQKEIGGTIILNGAKEDEEFLSPLNEIENSVNYIGKLSLINSCALIGQADVMLSGDSGPLHIATALGVKSIGLFGSMPEKRTGCYCNGVNIVSKKSCVPCNRRKCTYLKKSNKIYAPCMEEISVDEIFETVKHFIK